MYRLLLADFKPDLRRIIARPFLFTATVHGGPGRHIPD
jgi:hypothetical protein